MRGNCSVTPIAGSDFDAHSLDATTVRIRTAKEFFYFDKTQYAYEGVVSMFIVLFKLNCYIGKIPSFLGPFTICLYMNLKSHTFHLILIICLILSKHSIKFVSKVNIFKYLCRKRLVVLIVTYGSPQEMTGRPRDPSIARGSGTLLW